MIDPTTVKYTEQHEWVALDGDIATVGITAYAVSQLGDVVFVELPAVGAVFAAGDVFGDIESVKSVGELYAPLRGEVLEVNDAVVDDPSLVNADAFAAWLVRLRVSPAEADALLDHTAYTAHTGA